MAGVERLLEIMARLRDPDGGCPWDLEQDFASVAPYTIEEAYEVDDAIRRGDLEDLRDELGDLLLQVVFHAQMADEAGAFAFDDVVREICDKLVRRHPHVFGDARIGSATAQTRAWEDQKAAERAARAESAGGPAGSLDGVPLGLPALLRAQKLQRRAARVGFRWEQPAQALAKLEEELGEVEAELPAGETERLAEELGDVLFVTASLATRCGIDAEVALRDANAKFEARFRTMEALLGERGREAKHASPEEWRELWERAKRAPEKER